MGCFDNLVGLRSLSVSNQAPLYYLDDVEGIDQLRLADLATYQDGSGSLLAERLIDSSIRILQGDIETLIPSIYRITNNQLANICSSCNWSGFYANVSSLGSGIIIKNTSYSRYSFLIINSLRIMLNTSGSFSFKIDDGLVIKTITYAFIAGQEVTITGINYKTTANAVKIYFQDPTILAGQVLCPQGSTCGCGASKSAQSGDLTITGYHAGAENITQYGILACATIGCSYDAIVCSLVQTSPRLFGLSLLYLTASKVFSTSYSSQRVNRTASVDKDDQLENEEKYYAMYRERLIGNPNKNVLGLSQAINTNLSFIKDKCIACSSPVGIAWGTG